MPKIIPAILTESFEELRRLIRKTDGLFPFVQLDIMDGQFVHKKSFQEISGLAEIGTDLKYELHLMVNDPLTEMKRWAEVKNVFKVIVHFEAKSLNFEKCRAYAHARSWEFGLAISPDTELYKITSHLESIDFLLFLTVYPGRQGAPFQEKVLQKISEYQKIDKRPAFGVDGGINLETIKKFADSQAEFLYTGSALMLSPDIEKTYFELKSALE
jgi:ribulose-phosphate 3-epimerase